MRRRVPVAQHDAPHAVAEVDPDLVLLMPCGYHLRETVDEWSRTSRPDWIGELPAIQRRFAVAETLSHLERLVSVGRAERAGDDRSVTYTPRFAGGRSPL